MRPFSTMDFTNIDPIQVSHEILATKFQADIDGKIREAVCRCMEVKEVSKEDLKERVKIYRFVNGEETVQVDGRTIMVLLPIRFRRDGMKIFMERDIRYTLSYYASKPA